MRPTGVWRRGRLIPGTETARIDRLEAMVRYDAGEIEPTSGVLVLYWSVDPPSLFDCSVIDSTDPYSAMRGDVYSLLDC